MWHACMHACLLLVLCCRVTKYAARYSEIRDLLVVSLLVTFAVIISFEPVQPTYMAGNDAVIGIHEQYDLQSAEACQL